MVNLIFQDRFIFVKIIALIFFCLPSILMAQNDSVSGGEVFQELPTLHCLGVRWPILGDQNKNAIIKVSYKEKGSETWLTGFPLMRTLPNPHSENLSAVHTVINGWMFAGSILGLKPDLEYDVKLNLEDPDGAKIEKKIAMKTWKEPMDPNNMITKYVSPGKGGGEGTKESPYLGTQEVVKHLEPGIIFLFQKGNYNSFVIRVSGTIEKPIIFRGDGNGEAILEGGGDSRTKGLLVDLDDQKHIWFEDLVFQGMYQAMNGDRATNLVVRRCKFRKIEKCIEATNGNYDTSQHFFITDNEFIGDTTWPRTKGIESFCLTYLSGGGHVIAYNRISNTGDAVHGTGRGSWSACDIYANEMSVCTDDGIETDHCEFNIRVWGNRIFNVSHGITSQPSRGGPVYIFRNVIYNATYSPFKLHNHTTGVYIFHNTCFKFKNAFNIHPASETATNIWTRNNLFLCNNGCGLEVMTPNVKAQNFDNDGYGGMDHFAVWNVKYKYLTMDDAKEDKMIYFEKGAILINPKTCFMNGTIAPIDESKIFTFDEIDFRLAGSSDAIDKGVVLPNFNDGFKGKAPDLGALEFDEKIPNYGPRNK
jgi:hypothetical protein